MTKGFPDSDGTMTIVLFSRSKKICSTEVGRDVIRNFSRGKEIQDVSGGRKDGIFEMGCAHLRWSGCCASGERGEGFQSLFLVDDEGGGGPFLREIRG